MRRILLASTIALMPTAVLADPLFTLGNTFDVTGTNTPGNFNSPATPFTLGDHSLNGGTLNLNISIVPDPSTPQAEWVVFKYTAVDGPLFGNPTGNWNLDQIGVPSAVALNFIGDATQWFTGATALSQTGPTTGVFHQTLMPNPVPGGTGQAEGTLGFVAPFPAGPLPDLGAFIDPLTQLTANGINASLVTGYSQALEFAPQTLIPPPNEAPEPASLAILGLGLIGLAGVRRRA